jgi:glycosyltransferase involved in cell wall biosynthesis
MTEFRPRKVLITGGREEGGLASFAEGLRTGFSALGIPATVIPPGRILLHWKELRDPSVLKVLSTTAVFAAPLARRAVCMAHGFPRPDAQGWVKALAVVGSFKLANLSSGCRLVAVSHYAAVHLRAVYNLRVDAVIHNPLQAIFSEPCAAGESRNYITYVGRLVPAKNLHRILPAICELLESEKELRACVIGDGPQRAQLEALAAGSPRVEFHGTLPPEKVREFLRKTRVFVSGCETEALGLTYVEALSQGCAVAMPACGGGLEIAPELIGSGIALMPGDARAKTLVPVLRQLLNAGRQDNVDLLPFRAETVAARFLATGQGA